MKSKITNRLRKLTGFTMIETMIVLAIAGLIMVVVLIGVSEAGASQRDSQRKAYAGQVLEALEEYYKNNGKFPGSCLNVGVCGSEMGRFLSSYLPDGRDPSSGKSYRSLPIINIPNGVATSTKSVEYLDNNVPHNKLPTVGQVYIGTAHWCYPSKPDGGDGPPLAGTGVDDNPGNLAVVIYQERGGFYCLDNFAASGR